VSSRLPCSRKASFPRRTSRGRSWPPTSGTSRTSRTVTSATGTSTETTWTASSTWFTPLTTSRGSTAVTARRRGRHTLGGRQDPGIQVSTENEKDEERKKSTNLGSLGGEVRTLEKVALDNRQGANWPLYCRRDVFPTNRLLNVNAYQTQSNCIELLT